MIPSCLYESVVTHLRHRPARHALRYRIFSTWLNIDELGAVSRRCRLFSVGRFNLLSFHPADHGEAVSENTITALRHWLEAMLLEHDIVISGGEIGILSMPRFLGYAFNPITVYFCNGPDAKLKAVIYQVNNTFRQRHFYVARVNNVADDAILHHHALKEFHVSPFMPMAMGYRFTLAKPGPRFRLAIQAYATADGVSLIDTAMLGTRRELSDAQILRAVARMPVLGVKVMAAIYWEAFKLWRKKLHFYHTPRAPARSVTMDS